MRRRSLAVCVVLLAVLGCSGAEVDDFPAAGGDLVPALDRRVVFESFESSTPWVVDSADAPARLSRSSARATNGARSLRVRFGPGARRKISIRRDVSLDLTGAKSVNVDVWSAVEGVGLATAFVTQPGGRYFESQTAVIPGGSSPGEWQTVRFRLDGPLFKSAETGSRYSSTLVNADRTERMILVVYTGEAGEGEAFIDNVVFEKPSGELVSRFPPRNVAARTVGRSARVWGTFEIEVSFEASHGSPFDPREIAVFADVSAPSGRTSRVPGFPGRDGLWRIRCMPLEPGRHTFEVSVQNAVRRRTLGPRSFVASGRLEPGPVTVSGRDGRHFEFASGPPFYPVGMNVAWSADFSPYFEKFAAAGGNLVRVWLAAWSLPVASRRKAGEIDLDAADRLGEMLDLASENGLHVQLVLAYHGEFVEAWRESPYRAENGGPCAVPGDFFTSPGAAGAFRALLRYVAARYASHPALFAWELFNEADLVPARSAHDVVRWHREMAAYLRSCDPVRRPITTSVARFGELPELETLENIDFLQAHFYRPDLDTAVLDHWAAHARRGKPTFIGECGGDWYPQTDQADAAGARLRAALWLSLASPASGTAMPWWWDTQIDPNQLYVLWRPVAVLAGRIDRRGKTWRLVNETYRGKEGPTAARVHGVLTRTEGLLYFYDPRTLADPGRARSVLPAGGELVLQGLMDGRYRIEFWKGDEGRLSRVRIGTADGGRLTINLPPSEADFAVYLVSMRAVEPGVAREYPLRGPGE